MKKLKIDFFNYSDIYGGQEKYLSVIASFIKKEKYYYSIHGGPDELRYLRNGSDKIIFDEKILIFNGNKALYKNFYYIHRKPSIYIQHSDINDSQGPIYKRIIRKFLLYFFLKKVDAVIRVCNKCLPDKYAKGKITTVYNGVELKVETARKPSEKLNLLMVGAVNDNKNQRLAIEALPHILDVTLTIVGAGGDVESLKLLANNLGVSGRIHWAGFQQDPTPYYEQADLLLMLSKNEAFPFVVLEAMAYGIPVVAVPVGGVPEVVQHLENGLLLDSYQPQDLAESIKKIQQNEALYTALSKNAIQTIKNKFSLENMTQGFLAVVNQVLAKSGKK
jgi:glycosyltransferase involved in cell wall biosynthesis